MASRLKTGVQEIQERGAASIRGAKAQYDASGRFAQMRFWILVLFVLDLSGTVGYVVGAADGAGPVASPSGLGRFACSRTSACTLA